MSTQFSRIDDTVTCLVVTRRNGSQYRTLVNTALVPILRHWRFHVEPRRNNRYYFKCRIMGYNYYLHRLVAEMIPGIGPSGIKGRDVHHQDYSDHTSGKLVALSRKEHSLLKRAKSDGLSEVSRGGC